MGDASGTYFLMSCRSMVPTLPAAGRPVLAEEISPAGINRRTSPRPQAQGHTPRELALRSGPQAVRTKRGTHSGQELLVLCPLSPLLGDS